VSLELTPNDTALRSDPVARLALTLAKELWLLKDRQLVLEAVLSRQGVAIRDLVENYQPDPEQQKLIAAERQRFVAEIIAALQGPGDRR
jgi:hypothetical protein